MSAARRCAVPAALLLALGCAGGPPEAPPTPAPAGAPSPARRLVVDGSYRMGTLLEVTLVADADADDAGEAEARRAIRAVFDEIETLDALLSVYRDTSDVSRLNRAAGRGAVTVDPRTAEVLRRSVEAARRTDGVFDVTVGPLVDLWVRAARADRLPAPAELDAARGLVDAGRIALGPGARAGLPQAGMRVDLGGIGKGYALDLALPGLRSRGFRDALLNFGQSSVWALGAPPDAPGWRLLVRDPRGGYAGTVTLRDRALSLSSSLGQWSEIEGVRYGHVIDPRSGRPLTRGVEVAVVAPDATTAEVLSTALLVLDESRALALVDSLEGAEALIVDADGRAVETSGWTAATHFAPLPAERPDTGHRRIP